MKYVVPCLLLAILLFQNVGAQSVNDSTAIDTTQTRKFNYKSLILPSALISYGFWGMESHQIQNWNVGLREEVTEDIDTKVTVDDFSQWAPAASVFALDAAGVKAKHDFRTRATVYLSSFIITNSIVYGLKYAAKVERPDSSAKNSFPSGHTANAFMGAEFLWQEYKDKSIWYGIAGYGVATATGLFRIYNNRHWLTDVAAGAGIGILGTKMAYWINPWVERMVFGKAEQNKGTASVMATPVYDGKHVGVGVAVTF